MSGLRSEADVHMVWVSWIPASGPLEGNRIRTSLSVIVRLAGLREAFGISKSGHVRASLSRNTELNQGTNVQVVFGI